MQRFVLKYAHHGIVKYLAKASKIHDAITADVTDSPNDEKTMKFWKADDANLYRINELQDIAGQWEIVKIIQWADPYSLPIWKEIPMLDTPLSNPPLHPTQENPMAAPFKSETEDRPKYEEGEPFWVIGGAHNKDMYFQQRYDENAAPDGGSSGKPYSEAYQFTPNLIEACLYFGSDIPKSCFRMGRKIAWKHKEFLNLPETEVRFYHGKIKNGVPVLDPCQIEHYYNTKEDSPHMKNRIPEPKKHTETDMLTVFLKIEEFSKTLGVSLHKVLNTLIMQTVEDMAMDLGMSLFEYIENTEDKKAKTHSLLFLRDLFKRSIEGNKRATAMAEKEGRDITVLGRLITARKAMQLLHQKIPEYVRLSKNLKDGQPSEADVNEVVEVLLRKLGIEL